MEYCVPQKILVFVYILATPTGYCIILKTKYAATTAMYVDCSLSLQWTWLVKTIGGSSLLILTILINVGSREGQTHASMADTLSSSF